MTLALLYWILLLLALVGGVYANRSKWAEGVPSLIAWLLFLVIGWAVFGSPVKA